MIDFGVHDDKPFLVMDLVRGTSLIDLLETRGRFEIARAVDIVRQVLSGLAHAHELGIVHRDIKPANIMLTEKTGLGEQVRILDFGLARPANESTKLTTGIVVGTPNYMAPEQIKGGDLDGRTDLYACGVMLFELLTGKKPFTADDPLAVVRKHLHDPPPRLADQIPDVDLGDLEGQPDGPTSDGITRTDGATGDGVHASGRTVFVIPMENESSSAIYANTNAPYINNTLMPEAAYTTMFTDELASAVPSEPHYVWMEAGTNVFSDVTFLTDNDPSSSNSTSNTAHLATQLKTANLDWVSYQEGITAGTCPIASITANFYAAKHDPFVFFQDISGSPPSSSNAYCAAHHKPYSSFATDLAAGTMPALVFITGDLCHDMHGDAACPQGAAANPNIAAGDTWLSNEMPRILAYATAHDSIIYLTWDEGSSNQTIPFLALGPHVKTGTSTTAYTHSSQVKSIEEQLGLPVLASVSSAHDFTGWYEAGSFP